MKVAFSGWGFREWFTSGRCDYSSFLDTAKAMGADGIEIFPNFLDQDDIAGHVKQIADKADQLGLGIASLIIGNDYALPTNKQRAQQVERSVQFIEAAVAAGIERLNIFTGYHRDGTDPALDRARVVDCFLEVCPVAEAKGAVLCLENHSSVHPDADGLLAIVRDVGSPALKTNPDPSNFVRHYDAVPEATRNAIYTETAKIAPLMANSHLKIRDFNADGSHAHLDVPRLLDLYREHGYDGWVVLEYHGQGDPKEPNEKGLAMMRGLVG